MKTLTLLAPFGAVFLGCGMVQEQLLRACHHGCVLPVLELQAIVFRLVVAALSSTKKKEVLAVPEVLAVLLHSADIRRRDQPRVASTMRTSVVSVVLKSGALVSK